MILHPETASATTDDYISAWQAIEQAQRVKSQTYHLVHQPDHAHLAGELAQHLTIPGAPPLSAEIAQGIWAHDEGWSEFDSGVRKYQATPVTYPSEGVALNPEGKPLSFMEVIPGDALSAWDISIDNAESIAPVAGLVVGGHFRRLAQSGLAGHRYSAEDESLVRSFLEREERRRDRLMKLQTRTEAEISYWTDVLRFCDLLSLYLCSGSAEAVEFPERLGRIEESMRLKPHGGVMEFSPAIFDRETDFVVTAYRYPGNAPANLRLLLR